MPKIKPTVGRVVWFHPSTDSAQSGFAPAPICAAIVAYVHNDSLVNLAVFDSIGSPHSSTNVPLIQGDDIAPPYGYYCEWMPYQLGQAARTEVEEARVG